LGERSHGSGHQCSGDQGIFEHHFFLHVRGKVATQIQRSGRTRC
jgi:hypothetical protein